MAQDPRHPDQDTRRSERFFSGIARVVITLTSVILVIIVVVVFWLANRFYSTG